MKIIQELGRELKIYTAGIIVLPILSIISYMFNNQKLDYNFLTFFALFFGLFFIICVIGFFSTKKTIKTYSQLIERSQKEFGEKNENHRI
ncbi:hypothetical protein ELQ15_08455 [Campylobacter sp. US12a]|uniref:hypothetical protein n=1 Tax=Campylobacter sp. US12a TaxID=2498116 RepID=UPI0010688B81|nr:hypothetical protein [Campylobacter sp. US12a]TEY04413.1 hypothetical protein ELQ15_08455 [Campylobacter sp. US12a]